ncbi:unnamed protein product [Vicia faba]|uniref:Uncharacterized protein n=1 Tax=Vicia faba TaxID=3906 RepID=A0AAV0ZAY8_VICFA|nr:unnamed protein product [Vicia faba]
MRQSTIVKSPKFKKQSVNKVENGAESKPNYSSLSSLSFNENSDNDTAAPTAAGTQWRLQPADSSSYLPHHLSSPRQRTSIRLSRSLLRFASNGVTLFFSDRNIRPPFLIHLNSQDSIIIKLEY